MTFDEQPGAHTIPAEGVAVARDAMNAFADAKIPFLVGGAYALACYTGIERYTKDFDVFVEESQVLDALEALSNLGFRTEIESEVWLAKAYRGEEYVDLIFNSGNAITRVDQSWFDHAPRHEVFGVPAMICPPEEMIWAKSYIMERHRYDGADVAHLLRCCAEQFDWQRLLERFSDHWRVLLSHLLLFGFIYPSRRDTVPDEVMRELLERAAGEVDEPAPETNLCRGTLLSRTQYAVDIDLWGCTDGRIEPHGELTAAQARELSGEVYRPYRPQP
jgi:hypothetical protein